MDEEKRNYIIRPVDPDKDSGEIAEIYKWYVENTTVTFEEHPLNTGDMLKRITDISSKFPYYVCEEDGNLISYCYVHAWKAFSAYKITVETTIYVVPWKTGNGIGWEMMRILIDECKSRGYVSLIACITSENKGSCRFHERLGFKKVSDFKKVGEKFGRLLDVTDYQLMLE